MKGFIGGVIRRMLLAAWFAGGACAVAGEWVYEGERLPTPPEQGKGWEVKEADWPEGLRPLAGGLNGIFAAGWADPRGGEYRDVVIPGQTIRSEGGKERKTRGWVLPGSGNRYVVAWDGLVYPVISVGEKGDVNTDVRRVLEGDRVAFAGLEPEVITPGKVAVLARLGMMEEADTMWKRWTKAQPAGLELPGIFSQLAQGWLWGLWERAAWAHEAGDFRLAVAYLEALVEGRKRVEAELARRGSRVAKRDAKTGEMGKGLDLSFMDGTAALLADERRRLEEKVESRPEIENPESVADKGERIRLLIRDLEEVRAKPMISRGYPVFAMDPVVKGLVAQGEDAVEPLLEVLEKDGRLTRTLNDGPGGWWKPGKLRVVGVEEPALAALEGILRSRNQFPRLDVAYASGRPAGPRLKREALAKVVREYWDKYGRKPLPERWHGLLAEDGARPEVWAEAAENLTTKEWEPVRVYGEMALPGQPPKSGEPDPMRGEAWRETAQPPISDLMSKRLGQAYFAGRKSREAFAMGPSERLAKALVAWDGKNQIETLRWYSAEQEKDVAAKGARFPGEVSDVAELVRTYVARHELGDERALADYAKWLRGADAMALSQMDQPFFLAPLWRYPKEPEIVELTKWIFTDEASPWRPGSAGTNAAWVSRAAGTPLVAVPEFRAMALGELDNPLVVGRVDMSPEGRLAYLSEYASNQEGSGTELITENARDVTLGDKIALGFGRVRGVPEFSPKWPEEKRAAAKVEIAEFVRKYGDRWVVWPETPWEELSTKAGLDFPKLEAPATREDVALGRAIFSTEGASNRVVWPLPERPMRAWWITRDEAEGTDFEEVEVWQAEDAVVERAARRIFGVVGRNEVAEVEGEEIEFDRGGTKPPGDGWEVSATLEDEAGPKRGGPAPVKVKAVNLRGIPRQFIGPENGPTTVAAEKLGLEVRLKYFPGPESLLRKATGKIVWIDQAPRGAVKVEMIASPRLVDTLGGVEFLRFDAAKVFDLNAPGVYRVELVFHKGGIFNAERTVETPWFEIKD